MNLSIYSYADNKFFSKAILLGNSLKPYDLDKNFRIITPVDLDKWFITRYKYLLKQKRGGGYWVWKLFVIYEFFKNSNIGDVLFYSDAAATFVNNPHILIDYVRNHTASWFQFEHNVFEYQASKRDLLTTMNADIDPIINTPQRYGGNFILKNCPENHDHLLNLMDLFDNYQLVDDSPNILGKENHIGFKFHRHDQSILSIYGKLNSFMPLRDISQYGNNSLSLYPDCNYPQIISHDRRRSSKFSEFLHFKHRMNSQI